MFVTPLYKRAVLLFTLLIAPAILPGCSKGTNEEGGGFPPPAVSVAEVVVRDVMPWNVFNGRVEAIERVQLRPRVGGVIEKVQYLEGGIVKKGDLLFVIDQHPFRAELERAEAELARALAQAELARVEHQRAANLFERKLVSRDEYDQRIAAEAQANATVGVAESTVQLARLNMEYTHIRSPIDGRAGRAFFTKGNLVASDPTPDVLTTVISLDPVHVYFDSDELTYLRDALQVRKLTGDGERHRRPTVYVGVGSEDGFPREGIVDFVDNQIDPNSGTIGMRAILENKDYQLVPGLFARVKLLGREPEQVILIDDKAMLTDQDRKYVYVLGPENQALRRDIEIGKSFEGLRAVISGLNAGDQVIVHGIQKVFFPGMPVTPQKINMGDPPPAPASGH